jgi:anti-sigma regulatory factor (Ser/Thr protein kinase)
MSVAPSSQIDLRATLDELERLSRWIGGLAEMHHLPQRLAFQLDLCLTEIVTNVICHAYTQAPAPADAVAVRFVRQSSQVVLQIEDRGVAFDPVSHVLPELPSSLAEASTGGWGLRLVRKFAETLHYQRDGELNRLTMVFPAPLG